jgi:RNA polymerase sigma factor (sigma-70 family)
MTPPARKHDLEELLAGSRWVRGLARGLLRDSSSADDVVQDAWVAALTRPAAVREPGAWLAGVVRHMSRRQARSDERRQRRETAAARSHLVPSAAELVERSELQERLSAAVRALDEPYRSTVLLHYAEGLSLEQIATNQGVPASTVRTRLARALERLRARLDREHGGRETWLAALAPMAGVSSVPLAPAVTTAALGSVVMGTKAALGIAALAAAVAVFVVSNTLRKPAAVEQPSGGESGAGSLAAAVEAPADDSPLRGEAERDDRRPADASGTTAPPPAVRLVHGSLLAKDGEHVEDAYVTFWNDMGEQRQATVAPGSWSIVGLTPGPWEVSVQARGCYPLRDGLVLEASDAETRHDLTLERARTLRIRFIDENGETVIGADTRNHPLLPGLGAVATLQRPPARVSGVEGRMPDRSEAGRYLNFLTHSSVEGLPANCAGLLELTHPPPVYISAVLCDVVLETRLDTGVGEEMVFVIDPEALKSTLGGLTARLVDAHTGAPIEGSASLACWDSSSPRSKVGPDGVVRFEGQIPGPRILELHADKFDGPRLRVRIEPGVVIDLGDIPLAEKRTLEGTLVDEQGKPLRMQGNFRFVSSDFVAGPLDLEIISRTLVDENGHFQIWSLGAGTPVPSLVDENFAANPLLLDSDAEGRIVAIARRGTQVVLRHGQQPVPGLRYSIADASGRPIRTQRVWSEAPIRLRLIPGTYQLLVGRDEVFVPVRRFEVGSETLVLEP